MRLSAHNLFLAAIIAISTSVVPAAEPAPSADSPATTAGAVETVAVKLGELSFNVPKSWEQQQPKSTLRLGQFSIPAVDGDKEPAELAIFEPIAGTVKQNIERWVSQFSSEGLTSKMTKGTSEGGDYIFVELTGSYKKPIGAPFLMKSELTPGYSMLGVVYTAKGGGNYFFKLTGPTKTATAAAADYRHSFGGSAETEKEYTLE